MKKLLLAALILSIVSCNSSDKDKTVAKEEPKEKTPMMINTAGYTVGYSSQFEMGNPKNAEVVAALWKDWDSGDLTPGKSSFADTMTFLGYDGAVVSGPRDSAVAATQAYRNTLGTVQSRIDAIFPARSTNMNEDWALIWGTEIRTDKKSGKVDSVALQETWRFNKDGKVDLIFQYSRALPAPPKK